MPDYRLYRLRPDNRIIDRFDIDQPDDEAAILEAIGLEHTSVIEIWSGQRLVSSVAPGGTNARATTT